MSDQITARVDSIIVRVDSIIVGERYRKDLGDIAGLADNIANDVGHLLHRIVVRRVGEEWHLVAGERRLAAAKAAGWETVPVEAHLHMDDETAQRAQFAENIHRKDFTLSEAVVAKRDLEALEKAAATARMLAGKPSGNLPKGRAADKAAKATGMSRRTLEKAEAVFDAGAAEPEKFGPLVDVMDRTGRVNGVFKRLKVIKQAELIRAEPSPLPGNGPYRVLVADPGWPDGLRREDPSHRANSPYHTEAIERICKHDIASIVHEHAILFLWVVNFILVNGLHLPVLHAWGDFQPITLITWNKGRMGHGDRVRSQTEHVIVAIRRNPLQTCTNQSTWLDAVPEVLHVLRGKHSVKPRGFYDLVESLCPAPRYADLFSRYHHNEKWDCYGDQAPADYDAQDGGKRAAL